MKTNSNLKRKSELLSRPEQVSTGRNRMPKLDFASRHANRQLPTPKLLELLRNEAPEFCSLAQVVGRWVWIHFNQKQPQAVTRPQRRRKKQRTSFLASSLKNQPQSKRKASRPKLPDPIGTPASNCGRSYFGWASRQPRPAPEGFGPLDSVSFFPVLFRNFLCLLKFAAVENFRINHSAPGESNVMTD